MGKLRQIKIESSVKWPKEVPVLRAKDMLEGDYYSPKRTKCCLVGHYSQVFERHSNQSRIPHISSVKPGSCYAYFIQAITKAGRSIVGKRETAYSPILWNDVECKNFAEETHQDSNLIRARVWNLAMALLGYTEGNPEAELVQC